MFVELMPPAGGIHYYKVDMSMEDLSRDILIRLRSEIQRRQEIPPAQERFNLRDDSYKVISWEKTPKALLVADPIGATWIKKRFDMEQAYGELFRCSTAYVSDVRSWNPLDVALSENKATLLRGLEPNMRLSHFHARLHRPRSLEPSMRARFDRFLREVQNDFFIDGNAPASEREIYCYKEINNNIASDLDQIRGINATCFSRLSRRRYCIHLFFSIPMGANAVGVMVHSIAKDID